MFVQTNIDGVIRLFIGEEKMSTNTHEEYDTCIPVKVRRELLDDRNVGVDTCMLWLERIQSKRQSLFSSSRVVLGSYFSIPLSIEPVPTRLSNAVQNVYELAQR